MIEGIKLPTWRQRTPHEEFVRILQLINIRAIHLKNDEMPIKVAGEEIEKLVTELKKLEYFLVNSEEW